MYPFLCVYMYTHVYVYIYICIYEDIESLHLMLGIRDSRNFPEDLLKQGAGRSFASPCHSSSSSCSSV